MTGTRQVRELFIGLIAEAYFDDGALDSDDEETIEDHMNALDSLWDLALSIPTDHLAWPLLEEVVIPVNTPWSGERIWVAPWTQNFLDHILTSWATPTHAFVDLRNMVLTDQQRLPDLLVHPDEAAHRLSVEREVVDSLIGDGALSYATIDNVTFVLDDEALNQAVANLAAWTSQWGA